MTRLWISSLLAAMALGLPGWVGAQLSSTSAVALPVSLYITQQCAPTSRGGRCSVAFVQVRTGVKPAFGEVQQACAPGWIAHVSAQRGTVERGGVNRGEAVVCGYTDPLAALRALMKVCDEQTLGICRDANQVSIRWGVWDPASMAVQALPTDTALPIERLPQAQACVSPVPLVESASCPPAAAVLLRQAGLR